MTVVELKRKLDELPDDAIVFVCDSEEGIEESTGISFAPMYFVETVNQDKPTGYPCWQTKIDGKKLHREVKGVILLP